MGRVLKRERCPNCAKIGKDRKGDNLAIYDDGGEHCWSCGYHKHGDAFRSHLKPLGDINEVEVVSNPMPYDITSAIPFKALQWLGYYHITWKDIVKHHILWSDSREMLVFPINDCWQARCFSPNDKSKWYTKGDIHENVHITLKEPPVILVEDILSYIRLVNCGFSSCCLFGSDTNVYIPRLRYLCNSLTWWLDYDKKEDAYKQAMRASNLGFDTKVIVTELDPKCYKDEEIKNILSPLLTK